MNQNQLNVKKENRRRRTMKDPAKANSSEASKIVDSQTAILESGLRVVAIDENAIDDRKLIGHFQELCKQQNPGSVHFELKLAKEEMQDSVKTIAKLREKIHSQAKELKLLRGTGGRAFSSRWDKLRSAVLLGDKNAKKAPRSKRKRITSSKRRKRK